MRENRAVILAAGKGARMGSQLPKVLHTINGRPMIVYVVEGARAAGIENVTVVVGYGRHEVAAALDGMGVSFAVQGEQRGTGHAVLVARDALTSFTGNVTVLYGDMPLLRPATIRSLACRRDEVDAAAVALTIEFPKPPDFGRIVRDDQGRVVEVVEVKDASPEQLLLREVNVGAYCFDAPLLLDALGRLGDDNQQGEYYLTEVLKILAADGRRVETVVTPDVDEALGVNDLASLAFAEKLGDLRRARASTG
jgi:bifunctional UDP-N-acetylglucosamine pyrophosphorylase/glucosamine-1-phosphate N-acetyltransferase